MTDIPYNDASYGTIERKTEKSGCVVTILKNPTQKWKDEQPAPTPRPKTIDINTLVDKLVAKGLITKAEVEVEL